MSDRLDAMFDNLRGQQPPTPFATADAVRRRGRQRARRQVALAGVAVLAVAGLGGGTVAAAVNTSGDGTPPPAAAPEADTAQTLAEVPDGWLLEASDLGPGDWTSGQWEPEWTEGPDRWRWEGACPGYRSEDFPTLSQRVDQATIAWTDGPPPTAADPGSWVHQIVDLFPGGVGPAHLDDIRAALALCEDSEEVAYEITATGFAGDEALLVREEAFPVEGAAVATHRAVVRVGDAVVTVQSYDAGADVPERSQPDRLRELAQRAAALLP